MCAVLSVRSAACGNAVQALCTSFDINGSVAASHIFAGIGTSVCRRFYDETMMHRCVYTNKISEVMKQLIYKR
jgi:hypothetical protein